jgi:hypothetical protein
MFALVPCGGPASPSQPRHPLRIAPGSTIDPPRVPGGGVPPRQAVVARRGETGRVGRILPIVDNCRQFRRMVAEPADP